MKKHKIIAISATCIVVIVAIFAGLFYQGFFFYSTVKGQPMAIDTNATAESVDSLVDAMNDFSFEMYKKLYSNSDENVFFSPYSIFVALAMTYEGAHGETAEEMYNVLHFPQDNDTMLCSFGRIYNLLNIDKEYTLNTANALWIQENYPFLQEYLSFIENYYMGKASEIDFSNAEQAAQLINHWVEENTKGKIKDLLSSGDIHPLTKLILTNAVYFKGIWKYQFDPESTLEKDFEISPENTVKVPMMSFSESSVELSYTETDDLQILELPYTGDKLSMMILLPKEKDIPNVENMINYENLSHWRNSLTKTAVQVLLPKFKLETEYQLKNYLMDMGMQVPFTMDADFSGMTGHQELFIEKVIHKAFIEVNEEGTEAAGATSVHMVLKSVPDVIEFNADHPFILLIQHGETGNILFMGKVCNPQ